jgi:Ni,Fe-hydrogenase III small subunit/formate hydrogenlyase subunit 6/NADH:ubiquinone oxidoreductase subunit I
MLEWIPRALRRGRVTTRYPSRPELAPAGFRGRMELVEPIGDAAMATICPTGAIEVIDDALRLDRGRCVLCGACAEAFPRHFAFAAGGDAYETAARSRAALVAGGSVATPPEPLRSALGEQVRALRRSIHIRHVDAGSDGAEEWELQALTSPYYDIQRLGLYFTASPRHADVLVVTGGVTAPMREPLLRAWEVMPEPKALIAAGTDACSGGFSEASGLTMGGVDALLPVDVYVPGSPPAPIALLHGLLLAVGLIAEGERG